MKTEDAGDYGGTCDTCANGLAKAGHQQCHACEQQAVKYATEQEIRDDVNADATPFHALGKPRHWKWMQPVDRAELLQRLADARDLDVSARERENLCSTAHGEIVRLAEALQTLVDDCYTLVEQPSWIRPATGRGVYGCQQCEATKGDRQRPHADDCAVGLAENLLALKAVAHE